MGAGVLKHGAGPESECEKCASAHLWCLYNRDEHRSGLDRTGSGLKPILVGTGLDRTAIFLEIGGSRLDRTEKVFVVFM